MKKILVTVCTHGDEQAAKFLFDTYPTGQNESVVWDVIVANPDAMFLNRRFIESDLNRAFQVTGTTREHLRAALLTPIIQEYDVVYDIHQAIKGHSMPECIFVNEYTSKTKEAVSYCSAEYVVVDDNPEYNNHFLTSVARVGITLEYGRIPHDFAAEQQRCKDDFLRIVHQKKHPSNKIVARTYTALETSFENMELSNFVPLTPAQKRHASLPEPGEYYPVFVGQYPDVYCFINKIL